MRVGVLNGPKLDLLGRRDPKHYGTLRLGEIEALLRERATVRGVEIAFFQSNDEARLIDWVRRRSGDVDGWLVNAAALTHTSEPLREAMAEAGRPFVELHLSNVFAREPFRRTSLLADLAIGVIAGFKGNSYLLALDALVDHLKAVDEVR